MVCTFALGPNPNCSLVHFLDFSNLQYVVSIHGFSPRISSGIGIMKMNEILKTFTKIINVV